MKLYYAPDTCSLSPHIVLRELAIEFELVKVDNRSKLTADGRDFLTINPKGYVAALELNDGKILTEGPAILQYLADLKPERGLAPRADSWERVRLQEWLNFITSEIHAGSAPLFNRALPEEVKTIFREKLFRRFDFLQETLSTSAYLTGASFSVADAYLFTVLGWARFFAIELSPWPALLEYREKISARPAVQAALVAEATQ
ncbi:MULTISPECIES: glutathione transferase GstA [Enterobacter]|uniref:glutathione transferase GstA n=1 Tax=Enterobacter TaxID=547 RepID=UPI00129EAD30|nr:MULTISPECIES: glutathione transferase GstA [Enterobacter]MCR6729546.1 glutathione transferase GstA [Enterobacter cloacae]MEA5205890.1 glutathione transferase GstA [Enterobacter mori]MRM11957.1 glutathione transferase GstA [Enterobacter cloacae subsp. dissolvens]UUR76305.1 glutathione transferase GstA [Enterobacter cloacae complex sp. R_G8]CAF3111741.1 Glutathione S-transferase GST-6.0 [Enterobacter cloacae]